MFELWLVTKLVNFAFGFWILLRPVKTYWPAFLDDSALGPHDRLEGSPQRLQMLLVNRSDDGQEQRLRGDHVRGVPCAAETGLQIR